MTRNRLVALGFGTRPQVIKAARLLPALAERFDMLAIDTGQHYDYELNALLYEQLGVARPDEFLGVGSAPRDEQLEHIERACTTVLRASSPDAMVVIGDTNSTLGCARAAVALDIPVVHVEAGLRSHVPAMAEEMNRVEVDRMASVLCAPSRRAMHELAREGLGDRARFTGDIARDVLESQRDRCQLPTEWPIARGVSYAFATIHRAELTDDAELLVGVIESLAELPIPVVLALHPRTRNRLTNIDRLDALNGLHVMNPLGYLEALAATRDAAVVITDSGGVQREAYWLGVPCLTIRRETEWVETVECGANRLVEPSRARVQLWPLVSDALNNHVSWDRNHYGNGTAATSIVSHLATLFAAQESTAHAR